MGQKIDAVALQWGVNDIRYAVASAHIADQLFPRRNTKARRTIHFTWRMLQITRKTIAEIDNVHLTMGEHFDACDIVTLLDW